MADCLKGLFLRGILCSKGGKQMICENILILRKKRNLTQEALAEAVGVTRQTVAKWENGESIPDLELAGKLAAALDVSLDDLTQAPKEELQEESLRGKHMFGLVTIGDKGQIVIPVRARRILGLRPGDQLMVLGDEGKGLALINAQMFITMMEEMKNGN